MNHERLTSAERTVQDVVDGKFTQGPKNQTDKNKEYKYVIGVYFTEISKSCIFTELVIFLPQLFSLQFFKFLNERRNEFCANYTVQHFFFFTRMELGCFTYKCLATDCEKNSKIQLLLNIFEDLHFVWYLFQYNAQILEIKF